MKRIGYAFTDAVSGKPVYYYQDRKGTLWLKESRWSIFKILASYQGYSDGNVVMKGVKEPPNPPKMPEAQAERPKCPSGSGKGPEVTITIREAGS